MKKKRFYIGAERFVASKEGNAYVIRVGDERADDRIRQGNSFLPLESIVNKFVSQRVS